MRAVVTTTPGGVENLDIVERPVPAPGPGEVLIKVAAAGVNRADLAQRRGLYDPPPGSTDILGLECSGEIEAVGEGVNQIKPGANVAALLTGGGYAEYVTVPVGQVATIPTGVSLHDSAALMEVVATVWSNVFMMGKLQAGETLLLHGGGSGIGTMGIQLGKAFGATVVTTVGSPEKAEACRELGADLVIDYKQQNFAEVMAEQGLRADVVLDIIGAKYLQQNISVLNTAGRLVIIGLQGGVKAELDIGALLTKRAAVMATTLRARPAAEKAAIVSAMVAQVWPLLADGTVRPVVHATYPLDEVRAAHQVVEDSSHIGKVLLAP